MKSVSFGKASIKILYYFAGNMERLGGKVDGMEQLKN